MSPGLFNGRPIVVENRNFKNALIFKGDGVSTAIPTFSSWHDLNISQRAGDTIAPPLDRGMHLHPDHKTANILLMFHAYRHERA